MENVRKRVDVKLLRSDEEQKILKLVAKPTFARQVIFNPDLHMKSNVWSLLDINHGLPGEAPSETFPKMVKLLEPGIVSGFVLRGAGWGRRDGARACTIG